MAKRTFKQKLKRAAVIGGVVAAAGLGTAMVVSPNFRGQVVNSVQRVAAEATTRGVGAAAGVGAGYIIASGKRGWRKREGSKNLKKVAMIGGGVAGLISPPVGVGALAVTAIGKENWQKAGRFGKNKIDEWRAKRKGRQ